MSESEVDKEINAAAERVLWRAERGHCRAGLEVMLAAEYPLVYTPAILQQAVKILLEDGRDYLDITTMLDLRPSEYHAFATNIVDDLHDRGFLTRTICNLLHMPEDDVREYYHRSGLTNVKDIP